MTATLPRLMLAAPASGGGKTTLATALLRALTGRGLGPAAFKCGPDFIDPLFHREALGAPGGTLDLFLAPPDTVRGLVRRGAAGADIAVMEGVMGHYDGVGATARASGWHLAVETRTPVVLVLQPKGAVLSLAATLAGFLRFREDSMIRGVILNRCGEAYHRRLRPMLEAETGLPVLGYLPDIPEASFASRHLGLVTPDAIADFRGAADRLAEQLERSVDVPALVALAGTAPELAAALPAVEAVAGTPVRVAVAKDAAFCFHYRENLDLLRALGAELAFFSPLDDPRLPAGADALYLGGGYPELHAARLAANAALRAEVRDAVASGLPTIATGGGFLYLQTALAGADDREHPMVGLLAGVGRDAGRLSRFGYVRLRARRDNLLCPAGGEMPAHEFHRWDCADPGDAFVAHKASGDGGWDCVVADDTLFAGFPHLFFWSDPSLARRFVAAAAAWRNR